MAPGGNEVSFPLTGPAGPLEAVLGEPAAALRLAAVVAHPHPLYGGTMDNPVVRRSAERLAAVSGAVLRFNFRGVGGSAGVFDQGRGERLDLEAALAALHALHPRLPLVLVGYSFGAALALGRLGLVPPALPALAGVVALAPPLAHYRFELDANRTPLVLLCGTADALTPRAEVERQAGGWSGPVHTEWLAGAGHDLAANGPAFAAALDRALARCNADPPPR